MTSRIQGWSNRQKDKGWGYAFAHYIPGVSIYYSITRRTINNFSFNIIFYFMLQVIVEFCLTYEFRFPTFTDEPISEEIDFLISALAFIMQPLVTKYAITKTREDGLKRLKKVKEEVKQLKEEK